MQAYIDKHDWKLIILVISIGLLLPGCVHFGREGREIKPITAKSKLDAAAVAASIPTVYDTVEIDLVMIGDSVASKRLKLRPRSVLDVVARRDTSGTIRVVNGDTVLKDIKFSSSNATVAAVDDSLKRHEITTRGKSDRTDSKNRWPCMIGCGGIPIGAGVAGGMMYDPVYGQQYQQQYQYNSIQSSYYLDRSVGAPHNQYMGPVGRNCIYNSRTGRCY